MHDVIVVGGGVIGLSIADAIATEGKSVLVLDPGEVTDASSWAAAGMLAPLSEADRPNPLFDLCAASLRIYRDWAGKLQEESGIDPEFAEPGLLCVASTEDSLAALKLRMEWQRKAGFDSQVLTPEEIRRMEPHLTMSISGGVYMPGECQVTPRRLLEALKRTCVAKGVEIQLGSSVVEILRQGERVDGVRTETGRIPAECVVISAGVGSSEIRGLLPHVRIVPRKGQILSLNTPAPVFRKLIRWEHTYLVQRPGGELVVGATNEDAGHDRSLTPAGIGGLLARAQQLSSCTASLAIREMWSGRRPATSDGLPVIGRVGPAGAGGLIYATGHYRNGILLAPITASIVASLVEDRKPPVALEPCAPGRFEV